MVDEIQYRCTAFKRESMSSIIMIFTNKGTDVYIINNAYKDTTIPESIPVTSHVVVSG